MSGAVPEQDCTEKFNELKLRKKYKYIIFMMGPNGNHVVEKTSTDGNWDSFRQAMVQPDGTPGPRFAIYDYEYKTDDGPRSKIGFVSYISDDLPPKQKFYYSSAREALKNNFQGIQGDVAAHDSDEMEQQEFEKLLLKK